MAKKKLTDFPVIKFNNIELSEVKCNNYLVWLRTEEPFWSDSAVVDDFIICEIYNPNDFKVYIMYSFNNEEWSDVTEFANSNENYLDNYETNYIYVPVNSIGEQVLKLRLRNIIGCISSEVSNTFNLAKVRALAGDYVSSVSPEIQYVVIGDQFDVTATLESNSCFDHWFYPEDIVTLVSSEIGNSSGTLISENGTFIISEAQNVIIEAIGRKIPDCSSENSNTCTSGTFYYYCPNCSNNIAYCSDCSSNFSSCSSGSAFSCTGCSASKSYSCINCFGNNSFSSYTTCSTSSSYSCSICSSNISGCSTCTTNASLIFATNISSLTSDIDTLNKNLENIEIIDFDEEDTL